jgi:hypothetical protein
LDELPEMDRNDTATATATATATTADTILDQMMEQLLCKDIMYEPMKQVASQFPHWLQEHQTILSPTEYERYRRGVCVCVGHLPKKKFFTFLH